ncbi:hypothetical protein [Bacillus sp. V5-8f]|uniref:hypothetical protein n=1 Tax=Bacillus sp. V5-8f TaxID=2053044 RepID=UPI0015E12822|nr:hypothetical protein [Bacillus sp. V5-8f]
MNQPLNQGQFGMQAMQTPTSGMMAGGMQDGSQMRRGMMGTPQQAQNIQSVFQPNFGTNPQQVRQDIARDLAYGRQQQQQGGFTQQAGGMQSGMMSGGMQGGMMSAGMQDGSQMRRGMMGTPQQAQNIQSVLQPNFGTNPQQVRQDIARDLAYGRQQQQQGGFTQQAGGMQGGMMSGGMQGGMTSGGMQGGMMSSGMMGDGSSMMSAGMQDGSQMRRGMMGTPQQAQNIQSVLQPNFGTNPQQVRQDIARDLAYGRQQQQQGGFTQQAGGMQGGMMSGGMQGGMMSSGMQGGMMSGGMMGDGSSMMSTGMQDGSQLRRGMMGTAMQAQNAQAALQPNFGTNPQQVRQDIARDLAYGSQQQGAGGQMSSFQAGMMANQGGLS